MQYGGATRGSPGTALHAVEPPLRGTGCDEGDQSSSAPWRTRRLFPDESSPAREGAPRTLLVTAPAGTCGGARGWLSNGGLGRGTPHPRPLRPAADPGPAPLTGPAPAARSGRPSHRAAAAIAPPLRPRPGGVCFRVAAGPRPEPQPHVVRVDSSFRRRGPARHGRAAGGRARLPARAPEPAAGARHRQGPRGGSPWLLPGPPAARPGSSPRPSHPLARR